MLLRADPFGFYTAAQLDRLWSSVTGTAIATGPYGRGGGPGLRFSGDLGDDVTATVPATGTTAIAQFDIRISAYSDAVSNVLWGWKDGSTFQCTLNLHSNGTLRAYRSYPTLSDPIGPASTYVLPLNHFVHLGIKTVIGNSGSFVVHVWEDTDTAPRVVLSQTGVDTQATGAAQWSRCHMGAVTSSGTTDYCNLVVMDGSGGLLTDLLGPCDVIALHANARAAGPTQGWALSSGSSPVAVLADPVPDDDLTYVYASGPGAVTLVAVDPVPVPDREILGLELYASARKTDSFGSTVSPLVREGATTYAGAARALALTPAFVMQPHSRLPSGAAWSAAAIDALFWGLEKTA